MGWRGQRALQVGALRVKEHAGRSIPACREVPAGNHARNLRRGEVGHSRVIRHVRWWWRRRVVRNPLWHHRRRHGVVVGARRRVVSLCGVTRGIMGVALFSRNCLVRHFGLRRCEKSEDGWVRGVLLWRALSGGVGRVSTYIGDIRWRRGQRSDGRRRDLGAYLCRAGDERRGCAHS